MSRAAIFGAMVLLATAALTLGSQPAHGKQNAVVVLPMTSTAKKLQLYERAISSALAQELTRQAKTKVQSVPSVAEVPKSAVLIVEGRLVAKGRKKVLMEARVREAKTGRAVATVATGSTTLTNLDTLVAKLAKQLTPAIRQGLRPAAPTALPAIVVKPPARGQKPPVSESRAVAATPSDLLLIPASGSAAGGVVSVREPATASAQAMLPRLGFRVATSASFQGLDNVPGAVAEMRQIGARFVVMLNVRDVKFSYRGVLSARGSVQVAVIGVDGQPVFAKTVSTDTVVGSRGDAHQALVYQVASQALDMLLPEFRKLKLLLRTPVRG